MVCRSRLSDSNSQLLEIVLNVCIEVDDSKQVPRKRSSGLPIRQLKLPDQQLSHSCAACPTRLHAISQPNPPTPPNTTPFTTTTPPTPPPFHHHYHHHASPPSPPSQRRRPPHVAAPPGGLTNTGNPSRGRLANSAAAQHQPPTACLRSSRSPTCTIPASDTAAAPS